MEHLDLFVDWFRRQTVANADEFANRNYNVSVSNSFGERGVVYMGREAMNVRESKLDVTVPIFIA